jgi:cell wall-associated NlpC family hydrolase
MKNFLCLLLILILQPICFASPLVEEAKLHLNKPYIYAMAGPNSFDCSGFTYYCVDKVYDIQLLRPAYDQGYDDSYFKIENIEELQEGDLVYFNTNHSDKDLSDHAGIYIGDNQFIHASSSKRKVIISDLSEGYYNERFSWGRRIVEEGYNESYKATDQRKQLEACSP